jgi:hypothetical protein
MADELPITPHAAPSLNGDGQLTYIGNDGRRRCLQLRWIHPALAGAIPHPSS